MRNLALKAHNRLKNVMIASWDIATTPEGLQLTEVNVPGGLAPKAFLATDGIAHSRFGDLLAWNARKWLERQNRPSGGHGDR